MIPRRSTPKRSLLLSFRMNWVVVFRRNCVVDYGQFPSSAALDPHMSESEGEGAAAANLEG